MPKNPFLTNQPILVAEMANAHGCELEIALGILRGSAKAGVDALKLATYTADDLTLECSLAPFQITDPLWREYQTLYGLYTKIAMPWSFHQPLFDAGKELDLALFSSPFSPEAVRYLEANFDPPAYKIASFEALDLNLIQTAARTGKTVIISTGLAGVDEIERAIAMAQSSGARQIILLHCVSAYPTPVLKANLRTMLDMTARFPAIQFGLSDHSNTVEIPLLAFALGAQMVEKHLCLNREKRFPSGLINPDIEFSLTPDAMAAVVHGKNRITNELLPRLLPLGYGEQRIEQAISSVTELCHTDPLLRTFVETSTLHERLTSAIGTVAYAEFPEREISGGYRRSLMLLRDVHAGETVQFGETITLKRPGHGLHPRFLPEIIGKKFTASLPKGTGLRLDMLTEP